MPRLPLGANQVLPDVSVKVAPGGIRTPPKVLGHTRTTELDEDVVVEVDELLEVVEDELELVVDDD